MTNHSDSPSSPALPARIVRVECHCHTIYSKDSLTTPEALLAACERKGIDKVIVTDHNTIQGARQAQSLAPEMVIIGEEIMTTAGEILAFFVQEEIPPGLSPEKTLELLEEQGAFISISHPFDRYRKGAWQLPDLEAIITRVDAIETFNSRCLRAADNRAASEYARQYGLPGTAGSDAHHVAELGKATLRLPDFNTAEELRTALPQAEHLVRLSGAWVHFYSRYAVYRKRLGWAPGYGLGDQSE